MSAGWIYIFSRQIILATALRSNLCTIFSVHQSIQNVVNTLARVLTKYFITFFVFNSQETINLIYLQQQQNVKMLWINELLYIYDNIKMRAMRMRRLFAYSHSHVAT